MLPGGSDAEKVGFLLQHSWGKCTELGRGKCALSRLGLLPLRKFFFPTPAPVCPTGAPKSISAARRCLGRSAPRLGATPRTGRTSFSVAPPAWVYGRLLKRPLVRRSRRGSPTRCAAAAARAPGERSHSWPPGSMQARVVARPRGTVL